MNKAVGEIISSSSMYRLIIHI